MSAPSPDGVQKKPKRETFDVEGCIACGTHVSSSFRRCEGGTGRLCNACHCRIYRMKRKWAGLAQGSAMASGAPRHPAPGQQHRIDSSSQSPTPTTEPPSSWEAGSALVPTPNDRHATTSAMHALAPTPQALIASLQRSVLEQAAGTPANVLLHCAQRAQQATPTCEHRAVLAVLPAVRLQLPDDPPGLLHSVSCLMEAVCSPEEGGAQEAGGESGAPLGQAGSSVDATQPGPVSVRLTVFAAAGAVACWHEAPADPAPPMAFSSLTKAPIWNSGPEGFGLHFPSAFCPQVDLFTAVHQYVASAGHDALCQHLLPLTLVEGWQVELAAASTAAQQAPRALGGAVGAAGLPLRAGAETLPVAAALPPNLALHSSAVIAGALQHQQMAAVGAVAAPPAAMLPVLSGPRAVQALGLQAPTFQPMPLVLEEMPALPGLSCFFDPQALG